MEREEVGQNGTVSNGNDDNSDDRQTPGNENVVRRFFEDTYERNVLVEKLSEVEKTSKDLENYNRKLQTQVEDLVNEKTQLEDQLGKLKEEMETMKEENGALLNDISQVRALNGQLNADNDSLSGLLAESNGALDQVERDREELKTKVENVSKQVVALEREKGELRERISQLGHEKEAVESLGQENEELREKISLLGHLEKENGALGAEVGAMQAELESLGAQNLKLKKENGRIQGQLEEALKEVGVLREEKVGLQAQLDELAKQVLESRDGLDRVSGDFLAENSRLKSEIVILEKKLEDMGAEKGRQIEVLQEECFNLRKEKEDRRMEIESLQAHKSSTRDFGKVGELENQVKDINTEKRCLEDINRQLENEVKRLAEAAKERDKVKEVMRDFEVALETVHKALEVKDNTIQQLTTEIQSLQHYSSDEKQKGKSPSWPVVVSGALAAATAVFVCHKYSKHY